MYYDESTVDLVRTTLILTLKVAAPILGAGVVIGLVISILQSVTSIQDQTLTFVPKIVGMVLVTILITPWVVNRLVEFSIDMFSLV
ncbi:MAG: flagellar biosynthetic protein FliQ [Phycisphaerales bacterium]|nr:flagellar biosynthetic protein FliQ [Phycisphaerales bacterium]